MDIRTVIHRGDEWFVVSTVYIWAVPSSAGGYETMIFPSDESGRVLDWGPLATWTWSTEAEALEGHARTLREWTP